MELILGIMLILAIYFIGTIIAIAKFPTAGIWTWIKWFAFAGISGQLVCIILIGAGVIG